MRYEKGWIERRVATAADEYDKFPAVVKASTQLNTNRLHCRFCDWSTVKEYSKGGKFHGVDKAHQRLEDHVIMSHYAEWEIVQRQLEESEHD